LPPQRFMLLLNERLL